MPDKEKTVAILNLSRNARKYQVRVGYTETKDKEGNTITLPAVAEILPNQKPVDVPESEAKFLLGMKTNGQPRFPDLVDASTFVAPRKEDAAKALAENEKLRKENEELRAQLEKSKGGDGDEEKKTKGGNKK